MEIKLRIVNSENGTVIAQEYSRDGQWLHRLSNYAEGGFDTEQPGVCPKLGSREPYTNLNDSKQNEIYLGDKLLVGAPGDKQFQTEVEFCAGSFGFYHPSDTGKVSFIAFSRYGDQHGLLEFFSIRFEVITKW